MSQPLVSICMLCYNHEQFVREAIESILNQNYPNWELIIVDNASTDGSKKIIEEISKNNEQITFLPQEHNKLVSNGINIAIEHSSGEYISIISADDNFIPEKLEKQLQFMQEKDLDISFTWVNAINSKSETSNSNVQEWFNEPASKTIYNILYRYFSMHNGTCAPTALIKKSILVNTDLHDHRLLQTQDIEFWIRLFKKTQKVEILHEKLTNYRVLDDGGNLSSNKSAEKINRTNFEMLKIWNELYSLDNKLLSKVFNTSISKMNKHEVLYTHLKKHNIFIWQYTMLLNIYDDLGSKCDTESPLFQFFFEKYGEIGLTSSSLLSQKDENIKWLEEQLENHQKTLVEKEKSIMSLKEDLGTSQKALKYKGTFRWFINKILGRK